VQGYLGFLAQKIMRKFKKFRSRHYYYSWAYFLEDFWHSCAYAYRYPLCKDTCRRCMTLLDIYLVKTPL